MRKHEQISEHEYQTSYHPHPMASSAWADVLRVPILICILVLIASLPALIWYTANHWAVMEEWVAIVVFVVASILAVNLYFHFHDKHHKKQMRDLAVRKEEVELRFKQAQIKFLEDASRNRANVETDSHGTIKATYFYPTSPRGTVTEVQPAQKQIAAPQIPPPTIVTPVPTGRELLMRGDVNRALTEGKIILGPGETGGLKTLKIKKCFSTLVSGLPSVGKTTTVFWIVSQLILIGAKLWIVDPHMHFEDEEGNKSLASELDALSDSFVFPPCDGEPDEIIDRVKWMYSELCHRQRPGYIVRADQTIIGIMDEFNTVADSIDPKQVVVQHKGRSLNFSSTIALLEREGRKFGLHFMLIAHKWTQRDIGGDNALRTNATTYLCHRLNDRAQAELLMSGGGKQVLALTVGSYWITGPSWDSEPARITTPMISAVDIPLLLQMKQRGHVQVVNMNNVVEADTASTSGVHMASTWRPHGESTYDTASSTNDAEQLVDATIEVSGLPEHLQVKMLQVLQMDEQGDKNQNDIISMVWGVEPDTRQGRAAKDELKQIRAYLASTHLKNNVRREA